MSQSFGIVEEKLHESEFFLTRLGESRRVDYAARFYFSAFVSAARSVTWCLQATMSEVPEFRDWYKSAQDRLKMDPLARLFVEIRNSSQKRGLNPLNRVSLDHLREDLAQQLSGSERGHVLVLPRVHNDEATTLVDALGASELYFTSLVALVFECYEQFRCVVDPQWHFTRENFATNGRTFEDAVSELGFPAGWASSALRAVAEDEAWRILRADQPACGINDLFRKYVGRVIASPDQTSKMGN
jgi:hypothetical protein